MQEREGTERKFLLRASIIVLIAYALLMGLYAAIAGDALTQKSTQTQMLSSAGDIGALQDGTLIEQPFVAEMDAIQRIVIRAMPRLAQATAPTGTLQASLWRGDALIAEAQTSLDLPEGADTIALDLTAPLTRGEQLLLTLTPHGLDADAAPVSLAYGTGVALARGAVDATIPPEEALRVDGQPIDGQLCFSVEGTQRLFLGENFGWFALGGGVLLAGFLALQLRAQAKGRVTLAMRVVSGLGRYGFLIQQLVMRDFKQKYKRSVLGMFWSFLNPLLTMSVQYVIFSTIFRSGIDNFAVYLLCGIVCFNFFSEATTMALHAIISNAPLISKVYVPKYVFPLARVLSSSINLLLSFVPLFGIALVTGTRITWAVLLLPYGIACLFLFCLGIGLLLSTAMVFFRDTAFLWNVLTMLWMYATPIFYPASIIPASFQFVLTLNPLYHIITFIRTVLMQGVAPEPLSCLLCLLMPLAIFLTGAFAFWKNQDQFILNI